MAEPDGLVLYCDPCQYRDLRIREELRPAYNIAIATAWDGDSDTLVPFSECLDAHRQAYGPATEQSTNTADELAKLDAGLLRPNDLKEPAVSDTDSKVSFGDGRGLADLVAAFEASQAGMIDNVMRALGHTVDEPVEEPAASLTLPPRYNPYAEPVPLPRSAADLAAFQGRTALHQEGASGPRKWWYPKGQGGCW